MEKKQIINMEIWENVDDLFLDGEIFKDIDGYDGDYQISNYSRVKSFIKYYGTDVRILKQCINNRGYLRVKLYKNGKGKPKRIHNLMFESFNNYKLKEGECVHHINENKLNNDLNNFQLMTNSEHMSLHKPSEETKQLMRERMSGENHPNYGKKCPEISERMSGENHPFYGKKRPDISERMSGENHPGVILTEQKVIKIRELDLSQREISKLFGVSQPTISDIKNGKTWKHIIKKVVK